jgi:predicted SnoaL-like aldol condensation-catalyzing enzyme
MLVSFGQASFADDTLTRTQQVYRTRVLHDGVDQSRCRCGATISAPGYIQHNPNVPTGLNGFMDTFRARFAQLLPTDYKRELLNIVAEDDLVIIYVRQTWTSRDGKHHRALGFDMFRVQDGKIAEHWDADD